MRPRHYQGPEDLYRAQAALMQWVRQRGHCNYLHKGDIGHRLFNGCYGYDPADMMRYWLDENGEICAFAILYPHWEIFDLQVAPGLWLGEKHAALFDYCERETLRLARRLSLTMKEIALDVFDCDRAYAAFVEARGYSHSKLGFSMTVHDLRDIPEARLPAGFRFHQATAEDAARLADVHNHSFSSKWNAEKYAEVFQAPHMEYEFVVVAPNGSFATFTNVWVDAVNRSLLFEPVGAHSAFRRRGLGKALMTWVLRRMRAQRGIERAYVCHEPASKNPASSALYASVGFKRLHQIHEYAKALQEPAL